MTGEMHLGKLLSSMEPYLLDGEFVFCTRKDAIYGDYAELSPLATFRENEGLTLVLSKEKADSAGFSYESRFKCITLAVHSSLDAVGLTAAVSNELAAHAISANVIAAYYHDHIFVQTERAEEALSVLRALSRSHRDA